MNNNLIRVTNFLRRELTTDKETGEACRFELRHKPIGSKRGQEVAGPWGVPEKVNIPDFVDTVANEIVTAAESDADGLAEGMQRYVILVFRSKNPEKMIGRIALNIDAPDAETDGEVSSEPATKSGLQAQLMRHLEAVQRNALNSQTSMMQAMSKMVASVSAENEKLREQRIEMYTALEDVLTKREERELNAEESKARMRLMEDGGKKLMGLLPVVINRMSGNKPETRQLVAAGLLESFTDEQKAKLMQAFGTLELSEEQQAAAGELFSGLNNH